MASGPITSWQIEGEKVEVLTDFLFLGSKITADGDCSHEIKDNCFLAGKQWKNLDSVFKSKDITLSTKIHIVKAMVLPVVMYGWERWVLKKWCFWTVVLESPLDCKEIKPVNLKVNQPWILIGRTDTEAEALILWPPNVKSQLTGKDPDAWKDWRQKAKKVTEDKLVGWYHWCSEHDLGQTPKDGEGQRSLVCCRPWGLKESDTTWWLNNNIPLYICTTFSLCIHPSVDIRLLPCPDYCK